MVYIFKRTSPLPRPDLLFFHPQFSSLKVGWHNLFIQLSFLLLPPLPLSTCRHLKFLTFKYMFYMIYSGQVLTPGQYDTAAWQGKASDRKLFSCFFFVTSYLDVENTHQSCRARWEVEYFPPPPPRGPSQKQTLCLVKKKIPLFSPSSWIIASSSPAVLQSCSPARTFWLSIRLFVGNETR